MHPGALAALCCAILALLSVPRRLALSVLIIASICLPSATNVIVIAGVNFPFSRLLLFGMAFRMMVRGEVGRFPNSLDRWVILWAVWITFSYLALTPGFGSLINRFGAVGVDVVLAFFLCRNYLGDLEGIIRAAKVLVVITMVLSIAALVERLTYQNLFGFVGGAVHPEIRDGTVRCQGPFGISISYGAFSGLALPLIWALYRAGLITRKAAVLSLIGSGCGVVLSGSSSPVFTVGASVAGVALWRYRIALKRIRRLFYVMIIALEIIMNAHVWWLIPRLDPLGGSSYHRAQLIEFFAQHFGEWWLFGTRDNAAWGGGGYMTNDVSNYLLRTGTEGGILAIVLFLVILWCGFRGIGRVVHSDSTPDQWKPVLWAFGVLLFAHLVTFIGISYWDQIGFVLFLHLAVAASSVALLDHYRAVSGEWTETEKSDDDQRLQLPMLVAGARTSN